MKLARPAILAALLLSSCVGAATVSRRPPAPSRIGDAGTSFAPTTPLTARQRSWIDSTLATLSLRERIGQLVTVWVLGDYTNTRDSSFAEVLRWIADDGIGGVSMSLGSPIEVAEKVNAMQRRSRVPLLVSADLEPALGRLEGGVFTHYLLDAGGATVFPTAMAIAATARDSDAFDVARVIGREARAVGITINFAPVVDVNNNPANPVINTRSFGEDPARVARLAALFIAGSHAAGTMATAKHFPGHGDTDVDSHLGLPVVTADWTRMRAMELMPFRAAIDAGAPLVMSAHIALPAIEGDSTTPATLAPRIMTGVLRDTLGFRGVTITDALTMEGIGKGYDAEQSSVLALKAGADILLKPSDPTRAIDAVLRAVERDEITRARIDSSARRVLELKARSGVAFGPIVSLEALREVVGAPEHRALAAAIARRSVTLLRDRDSLVPVRASRAVLVQYTPETELRAGRITASALRAALPGLQVVRVSPTTTTAELDSLSVVVAGAERVIVAAFVRRMEGRGRPAVPPHVAGWVDRLAAAAKVVLIAHGNPYLIRQMPGVGTYLTTYSVGDAAERAAVEAILGRAPITGVAPVSLPGFFARGDGLRR